MDGTSTGILLLGIVAAVQLVLLGLQAFEHNRYAAQRLQRESSFSPHGWALVIIPCRGLEPNLEENLAAFFRQNYPRHILRFVTQSLDDPATSVIQRLMAQFPEVFAELVVAGLAECEAQKVHNLRVATASIPEHVEYLVFADSDASPSPNWLRALLTRLEERKVAAVTGYRWFIPNRGSFGEAVVSSLNGAYTMLMAAKTPNLVWGGSWAIRRHTFEKLRIRDAWQGQICDDLVVARLLLKRRLTVRYEPKCLVATPCYSSFVEMLRFIQRQYFLLRHVLPKWWLFDTFIGNFHVAVFWAAIGAVLLGDPETQLCGLGVAATLSALNWIRAEFRVAAAKLYFPEATRHFAFHRTFWWDRLTNIFVATLAFTVSLSVALRRSIKWRGITYRVGRDNRVYVLHNSLTDYPGCPTAPRKNRGASGSGERPPIIALPRVQLLRKQRPDNSEVERRRETKRLTV